MALPAYDRNGRTTGARGVAVDVTERNTARQSADAAQAKAAEDARHSADLMALLSHGLRVPLATILGFADLLEAEANDEASEAGGAISRAAGEVLETLDGFLDLSQLSALRTSKPSPIGAAGLRAALHTALAEGSAGTPATLDFDEPAHPLVLNLGLLGAVVRRLAVLASGPLMVRAEVNETHLMVRFESEGIGERLASDSLHTAYVYHPRWARTSRSTATTSWGWVCRSRSRPSWTSGRRSPPRRTTPPQRNAPRESRRGRLPCGTCSPSRVCSPAASSSVDSPSLSPLPHSRRSAPA